MFKEKIMEKQCQENAKKRTVIECLLLQGVAK